MLRVLTINLASTARNQWSVRNLDESHKTNLIESYLNYPDTIRMTPDVPVVLKKKYYIIPTAHFLVYCTHTFYHIHQIGIT